MPLSIIRTSFIITLLLCVFTACSKHETLPPHPKPEGRFLFQPQLIWANLEITHQGTGYLIKHGQDVYGVTSIHFMDFDAGGLREAIWEDINSSESVAVFSKSIGKPARTEIARYPDVEHDFILMPAEKPLENCSYLELESVDQYPRKTKLWFPNKSPGKPNGYECIQAEVIKDEGYMIRIKLLSPVKLQSQSGSPFINQSTGLVVGMLMGADDNEIFLCPARSLLKRLSQKANNIPLLESITK